jgi:hypothetical protein
MLFIKEIWLGTAYGRESFFLLAPRARAHKGDDVEVFGVIYQEPNGIYLFGNFIHRHLSKW